MVLRRNKLRGNNFIAFPYSEALVTFVEILISTLAQKSVTADGSVFAVNVRSKENHIYST